MFEVLSMSSHTGTQPSTPLIDCLVNDMLLQSRPFSNQASCNFFKSLFILLAFPPLSENSRIYFLAPKPLNLYKFSIEMRSPAAL